MCSNFQNFSVRNCNIFENLVILKNAWCIIFTYYGVRIRRYWTSKYWNRQYFSCSFYITIQALLSLVYLMSSDIYRLINYVGFATWVSFLSFLSFSVFLCLFLSFSVSSVSFCLFLPVSLFLSLSVLIRYIPTH